MEERGIRTQMEPLTDKSLQVMKESLLKELKNEHKNITMKQKDLVRDIQQKIYKSTISKETQNFVVSPDIR